MSNFMRPISARSTVMDKGITDGTYAILQSDGAAASFVNGKWQPGIAWDTRDFLDMPVIKDPQRVSLRPSFSKPEDFSASIDRSEALEMTPVSEVAVPDLSKVR